MFEIPVQRHEKYWSTQANEFVWDQLPGAAGYWGEQCTEQCPSKCADQKCDKSNGSCKDCEPGSTSRLAEIVRPSGGTAFAVWRQAESLMYCCTVGSPVGGRGNRIRA